MEHGDGAILSKPICFLNQAPAPSNRYMRLGHKKKIFDRK
nr:MAG TPA: hypothetical protein [Caudoviricetes sp.]